MMDVPDLSKERGAASSGRRYRIDVDRAAFTGSIGLSDPNEQGRQEPVAAVIPAFNEARHIGSVLRALRPHVGMALVVDDGSEDPTEAVARAEGAEVVRHRGRRGKGAAMRTGIRALRGRGHDYILFLDGDGQHDPDDAPRLIAAARERGYDLVIGQRALDRRLSGSVRYYTNLVACNMLSRWTGLELQDTQSGYRLVRSSWLDEIRLEARGFEIETEMLLKLVRRGARVGQVEIRNVPPSRRSRLRPVRDVTRICLSAVRYQYLPL